MLKTTTRRRKPLDLSQDRPERESASAPSSHFLLVLRFLLTGGINTAFSYSVYAAAIFLGARYALAAALSLGAGVLFSYQTARRLVFRAPGSLIRYLACYAFIYLFNVALLELIDTFGINPYACGLIAAVPTAALSFLLLRTLVFPTPRRC